MGENPLMGNIMQLQDFSVHDGDGIRTTVFLSGCPLRCRWCANPEGWTKPPKLAFFAEKCTGCGLCAKVCPEGLAPAASSAAFTNGGAFTNVPFASEACTVCGSCAERCPQGALSVMGSEMTVAQVVKQVERDSLFHGFSGGGVTFSGGEATFQQDFLRLLSEELFQRGISMWMETCGFFPFHEVEDILQKMDHIFFDLKHMDSAAHLKMTGQDNGLILENSKTVYGLRVPMTIRVPAIGGWNLTEENLTATATFVREHLRSAELELLPYHAYGVSKYKALHLGEAPVFETPTPEDMEWAEELLRKQGIKVVQYR